MFCTNCGKKISKDDKFCSKCGTDLDKKDNKVEKDFNNTTKSSKMVLLPFFNGIRWFFSIPICLISIIPLIGGDILGVLFFLLVAITISPLPIYKLRGIKKIVSCIIAIFLICVAGGISRNTLSPQNTQKYENVNNGIKTEAKDKSLGVSKNDKKQDTAMLSSEKLPPLPTKIDVKIDDDENNVSASYDKNVLDIIPLQKGKGWDKTLNQYGVEGVKKINALLPKAAEIMSKSKECDKLAYVAHSDRSTSNNVVVFGYCNNGTKFYLDEVDIKNKVSAISNKAKFEKMKYQLENACDEIIKSRLNHPQTFDKSFTRSSTYIGVNNIKITVGFTAKNSFNMKLKHTAVCFFNEKPELVEFTITEDK